MSLLCVIRFLHMWFNLSKDSNQAMKYTREFEIIEEENSMVRAVLCETGEEIVALNYSAAMDYCVVVLHTKAESELLKEEDARKRVTGYEPLYGGYILPITVELELEDLPAISLSEAANILGVSVSRVSQLCLRGQLFSWKKNGKRLVSLESAESRLLKNPGPGHPRTTGLP